ncbi:hypothetical protein EX895_005906 [Sporisorium graminicola]|uniref:Deoxycytidylate deaminase n=1 Tax=Sporisorium graminicola TaxID=280036 RepID=A0A4U7KLX4_9BASI|nr:hypothetical protein EX895_005906 [Sporisorium graminicola]TKY84826.1 hypothetical protein EX895_005906 [Sporisorium graminicola]
MLIALIGPPGAGKASVAHYLSDQHDFQLLKIDPLSSSDDAATTTTAPKITSLPSSKLMLDYVTDRWDQRFVTLDLHTVGDLDAFIKRPFFLCVEVGAPLLMRWERFQSKHGPVGLEQFVRIDDALSFGSPSAPSSNGVSGGRPALASGSSSSSLTGGNGIIDNVASISLRSSSSTSAFASGGADAPSNPNTPPTGLTALRRYVHLSINNDFAHLSSLDTHLTTLNLPSEERLRPCWDTYFLKLCNLASLRSNCMKRRVGAVLVASNRILATGYNGTPSGLKNCNQGGCARCNNTLTTTAQVSGSRTGSSACGQNLDECLCLHAEENALLEAGRGKIAAGGATMYCNTCPCLRCAVKIIQTGIKKVVYQLEYSMDTRTKMIFAEAGVEIRQFHLDA